MTTTITATPEPAHLPPRVRLDVTWTGATTAMIQRTDPDGTVQPVRFADPIVLTGGAATFYDYESWFGAATVYTATVGTSSVSASPVTLAATAVWLRHPTLPSLSISPLIEFEDDVVRVIKAAKKEPIGRKYPLVISDGSRKAPSSGMTLVTWTLDDKDALLSLFDDGTPLLLDVPPALGWGFTHQYMAVGNLTESRPAPDVAQEQARRWPFTYDVVDRPASGPSAPWTFAALLTQNVSFAGVLAKYATFADLLANKPKVSSGPLPPGDPDGTAVVVVGTAPSSSVPSQSVYSVSVNGASAYVYPTYDNTTAFQPHWGKFAIWSQGAGSATVVVTTNFDISNARIRPTIQAIPVTITGPRTCSFSINRTGSFSVEFNADPLQTDQTKPGSTDQLDPLFLFVRAPEVRPLKTDPNVYAYMTGGSVYTAGSVVPGNGSTITIPSTSGSNTFPGDLVVPSGKTVYIEPGAYFKGRIICGGTSATSGSGTGITIDGRGVVDATWQTTGSGPGNPCKVYSCSNTTVQNLVFLSVNKWAFRAFGCSGTLGTTGVFVKNVAVLSWADVTKIGTPTPDGIDCMASTGVTFDGVFVRSRDDSLTMKCDKAMDGNWSGDCHDNLVQNAVIWNGDAGNGFEIGYETGPSPNQIYNVTYQHSDIIHKTTNPANVPTGSPPVGGVAADQSRGAITIHNQEVGNIHDIRYEDIRIEDIIGDAGATTGGKDGIFYINSITTSTATTNIYFKDISVIRSQAALPWQIRGGDPTHRIVNVTFENLTINGTVISDSTTAAANGYLSSNVTNVVFLGTQSAGPTGSTLYPVADAWVQGNGTQSGTDVYLIVKNSTDNTLDRRSFLRFDATALGLGSCTSAKLRLWKVGNDSGAATPIGVYQITDDTWTEAGITWTNQPTQGSLIGTAVSVGAQQQYYEWDVTAYVSAQLAGDDLVSFAVWDASGANNKLTFSSGNAAANPPQLVISA